MYTLIKNGVLSAGFCSIFVSSALAHEIVIRPAPVNVEVNRTLADLERDVTSNHTAAVCLNTGGRDIVTLKPALVTSDH